MIFSTLNSQLLKINSSTIPSFEPKYKEFSIQHISHLSESMYTVYIFMFTCLTSNLAVEAQKHPFKSYIILPDELWTGNKKVWTIFFFF
jgi:hypothetical protein